MHWDFEKWLQVFLLNGSLGDIELFFSVDQSWYNGIFLSQKLPFNRKSCNHFWKSRCISQLSWNFLKTTNAQVLFFFHQSFIYVCNEQSCLKTIGLYDDLLFYLVCFTFSISYSVLPFHLVCFSFFPSLKCSFLSLYRV